MSQSDDVPSLEDISEDEKLNSSEEAENAERVAQAEEEYDPERPAELATAGELAETDEQEAEATAIELGSQDSADKSDDGSESDDSIVCDEIEYFCKDHSLCVSYAAEVDAFLLKTLKAKTLEAKERQAALAEVLCDHFSRE